MAFAALRRWWSGRFYTPAELSDAIDAAVTARLPTTPPEPEVGQPHHGVSMIALAAASVTMGEPMQAYVRPAPAAPGVLPATVTINGVETEMAMDNGVPAFANNAAAAIMQWGMQSRFHEGMGFFGYPYLAELAQRSEYRKITETIARDATRKWIQLKGPDETKLKALKDALVTFGVRAKFQKVAELDGYFGRGQIYVDTGETNLRTAMVIDKAAMGKGKLKGFTVIEPVWTYPGLYNSTEPLKPDFYVPREWYVMGDLIHRSRLLTFIGREVPDMLKASYAFGGLSMSQMAKPYVDNWLRTRQSTSDLIHSFSTMVLATDMASILAGGPAANILNRLQLYVQMRDNRGVFAIDKDTETLTNVSAPLSNLDDLQTQSAEQMCMVSGIPRLLLLGLSPKGSGIGDSGDGEMQAYFGWIKAYQERVFRPHLTTVINLVQIHLWGDVDPLITFKFDPLQEMDLKVLAEIRKSDAEAIGIYVDKGIVSNEEAREVVAEDEDGLFYGVDLSGPAPVVEDDPEPDDKGGKDA